MNEEYFCQYCGDSHKELLFLTSGFCSKSPSNRHQLYQGTMRGRQGWDRKNFRFYGKNHHCFCKYCGHCHVTIAMLTNKPCAKSPAGHHLPHEGEDKPIYTCKYCDSFSRSIKRLTRGSCSASPNKHHQPSE